jgi:hypothetical protein
MSTLTVTNIKATGETASRAVSGVAAAWLFYNGTGNAIRDSYNVASVTDNGAGDFTKNMTSAFSSANYSTVGGSGTAASDYRLVTPNFNAAPTTTATRMRVHYASTTPTDDAYISSTSHGDLA